MYAVCDTAFKKLETMFAIWILCLWIVLS